MRSHRILFNISMILLTEGRGNTTVPTSAFSTAITDEGEMI